MTRLALSLVLLVLFTGTALADARGDAEAKKKEGDKLAKEKKDTEALAAYEAAIDLDATYQAAYDAASTLWFRAKDYDRAIERLAPAVKATPDYAKGWYNLAFAYRKTSRFEEAVTAYKAFIQLQPTEPDPYYGLGLVYQALGKTDEARAALTIYIQLETRVEKQKFVDQAKAELAKLGEAKPATEAPVATAPDAAALKLEGDKLRDAGDAAGAEAKYRAAIAADATYQPAHNELGALLYDAGKLDEAIGFLEQAVTLAPKDKTAWYNLAHARRMAGRHAEAADAYRRYIEFNPAEADPYYGLGYALQAAGDLVGAREAFARYVALETRESEKAFVDKAKGEIAKIDGTDTAAEAPILELSDDVPPAGPGLTVGVGDNPDAQPGKTVELSVETTDEIEAVLRAANEAFARKEYDNAAAGYLEAVSLDPNHVEARYRLGIAKAAAGDLAGAVDAWERALLVDPTHTKARRNVELARTRLEKSAAQIDDEMTVLERARVLVGSERYASALVVLDGFLADEKRATHAEALALRGETHLALGDAAAAAADFSSSLASEPTSARALRGLGDAALGAGETARARYYFTLYLDRAAGVPEEDAAVAVVRHRLETL